MPTANRRAFVAQAINLFRAQDYPKKELLIFEDGDECNADIALGVKYHSTPGRLSTGEKRNWACQIAQGEIICLWDDDDYYGPERLSRQMQPLLSDKADITGLTLDVVVNVSDWTAWRCTPTLSTEVFKSGIVNGTLMFRKSLWGSAVTYPHKTIGEDTDFLHALLAQRARLTPVENGGDFVYIRYGENTWPLPPHYHPHMHEWQQVAISQSIPYGALDFYVTLCRKALG